VHNMEILKTSDEFASIIAEALRISVEVIDDKFIFDLNSARVEKVFELTREDLDSVIASLRELENPEETVISNSRKYEVLVREESSFPRMGPRLRGDSICVEDQDNSISYRLSRPTDEFLLFLLDKVSEIASPRALVIPMPLSRVFDRGRVDEIPDIFELLRRVIPRFLTLQIQSDKNRSNSELERFSSAFLFQLSYNLDVALVPQRHVEEIVRSGRINRVRRSSMDELDPPRRHYISDLVHHYQLAVGADNPFLEFISYYHVAEHFFETVFNQDLVEKIRNKITQPEFSYKRKKDIGQLIKDISKSLQIRNESITFSELEALKLTLENYIDFDDLKSKLDEYDSTLLEYYRTTKVQFSGGDEVDLNGGDESLLAKKLASRIYKTRNAIVHSKESDKSKYMPFRDDKILVREVPLLRFIAEQIIIDSSSIVGS